MERYSVRGAIQPGLKIIARYFKTGLGFQPGQTGWKIHVIAVILFIRAGKGTRVCASTLFSYLSKLAFSTPVLAQKSSGVEITSSAKFAFCDRAEIEHTNENNISARWAERNFSPGWNSPCNQVLIEEKISWLIEKFGRKRIHEISSFQSQFCRGR